MFTLLINETTDISIVTLNGEVRSRYLGIVERPDGKAVTVRNAILQFCSKMTLDIQRCLVAFGSDGTSVILGCRGGVS